MKTKNSKFESYLSEQTEELYEFANLDDENTGIKNVVIHVYSQGDSKKVQHGPRIKVSNVYGKFSKNDYFVIDIKSNVIVEGICKLSSKELTAIKSWITLNKEELIKYWNSEGEMLTRIFLGNLRKI